jgi:cobalt-zinc-cadmium resistance protein CzcA
MLDRIIAWSLAHRLVVILCWIGMAVVGVLSLLELPIDAFPDTTPIQVQVNTVAPALAPLEIERQLTAPLERAISGLPQLVEVRSISKFGLSQVTVVFEDGADIYRCRQVVLERIGGVDLPAGIDPPELGPVATGLGEVFHYLVTGSGHTLAELRSVQDWIVAPQLRSVAGVAEVNAWGGDERQIHIVVDPVRLQQMGLTLDVLAEAVLGNAGAEGGGTLDEAGESSLVRAVAVPGRIEDVEQMVVAAKDGVPIRIRDVARVEEGREIRRAAVTADGRGEVVLGLGFMRMGENSHDVTSGLDGRLAEIAKSLPAGVRATPVYRRTDLVEQVLHTVRNNLLEGALLVVAVLFAFLGNLRAGFLVALAIPLSMLVAGSAMLRFGIAGSLMSLGAIDFGLVVDSSVIQVENAVQRLSESSDGRSRLEIVRDAVLEVRKPTMFGELIIAIVYLPVLALEGVEGKLFRPMALTVVFALVGAMLLSLTLMPVLASLVLPRSSGPHKANVLVALSSRLYRPVVRFALNRPWVVLGVTAALLADGVFLASQLGSEFVPRLREGTIVINTVRLAGVSLDESVRYGSQIERVILEQFPHEVRRVWTRTGTPEVATDPMGVELSDVFVTLRPRDGWRRAKTQEGLVRDMERELASLPGMRMIFTQPIEMRVNEMIAGIRSDVGIKLFADDFDVLEAKAREIERVVRAIPGAADVVTEQLTGQPMIQMDVDRAALARHGMPAREVLMTVAALGRREVGVFQEGERSFPLAIRIDDRHREDLAAIGRIPVAAPGGDRVPLAQLARIERVEGPSTIQREWGRRRLVVQANVRGRDIGGFVAEARTAIDREVQLPAGSFVRFGGQFENLERARARLFVVVPVALALVLLLLYFTYGSVLDALRVFTGVPLAAVGGVLALWVRDLPFSISAGVGFVALFGVAVLNGLVLVSTIRQHLSEGLPAREAIERAALRRLRPVLMTALVASLGFLPMALNTGIGAEVQRPLATVVIGGVLSSTVLTLVLLPVLYSVLARRSP